MNAPPESGLNRADLAAGGSVRVSAPARLHLGFLDLHGGLGRRFGGIGIALEGPRTTLVVAGSDRLKVVGPGAARAQAAALRLIEAFGLAGAWRIAIETAIPEHAGLGSGTQLALALGTGLGLAAGRRLEPRAIAAAALRGARSGIGIGAFTQGGVIVDGGHAEGGEAPPIVSRLDFPEPWRVLLLLDPQGAGLHGGGEREAFDRLPSFPASLAALLCRLVLMQALPALVERDLPRFGGAVTELQRRIGDHFAAAQGGRFASPAVAAALAWLDSAGVTGCGQSSWGPTGFAFVASEAEGRALMAEADRRWGGSLRFMLVGGRNQGAVIEECAAAAIGASRAH
jgi:beta-ribofuranosylaminobenzene 5'-phosphate synthase